MRYWNGHVGVQALDVGKCMVGWGTAGQCGESSKHLRKFRVGTLNVNALRGRVGEVF